MTGRETRYQRYRAGLCVDCGQQPHSAGRPRCNTCHQQQTISYDAAADRNNYPCRNCGDPTRPGNLHCHPCFQNIRKGNQ